MPSLSTPVVGLQFHPPAKAVMTFLPADLELTLIPDPTNPYDSNAIQVHCLPTAIPETQRPEFEAQLPGYGITPEEFYAFPSVFLGYIKRENNEDLAMAFRAHPDLFYSAKLTFDSKGWPLAEIEWEDTPNITLEELEEEDEEFED